MIHLALTIASALFLSWFGMWAFAFVATILMATWRYVLGGVALLVAVGCIAYWGGTAKPVPGPALAATPAKPAQVDAPYEILGASVGTAVSASKLNRAPPIPEFGDDTEARLRYLRWLGAISERLKGRITDWPTRKDLLQTVWYESRRSGLDPSVVLALVQTTSNYRKFYVSETGARGYMGVNPGWTEVISDGDPTRLFHMQTNLRFGTILLRHYLDQNQGDLYNSLRQYAVGNLGLPPSDPKVGVFVDRLLAAQRGLVFIE